MQLDTSRFLSDRLIFDSSSEDKFQIANGFWDWVKRIVSWIFSPASYTEENRRTLALFKNYLIDALGPERLQRICCRYSIDLDEMRQKGSPLLSRDVAKIAIGTKCVSVEDIEAFIQRAHVANPPDPRFIGRDHFSDLDSETLASAIRALSNPFSASWGVAAIDKEITGRPTEWISRFFFDPFLVDRERLQLVEENPTDQFEVFIHNMVARVIKREMDVGALIPAPNHPDGRVQFYYVSAKLVTGKGMVSYILHPATRDTSLEPIRLFRGTSGRNSEIDALSTVITDLEKDLGRSAYESGNAYERILQERHIQPETEAGHSMGSTVVQLRLANMDHIRTAYLYSGPGIPEEEVEKFNQKNPAVRLVIRRTENDGWHKFGEVHLGYRAPPNVEVDFLKFHAPNDSFGPNPHVTVWDREQYYYGIEGGMSPAIRDEEFYHKNNWEERLRSTFCPIVAKILEWIRDFLHFLFNCRLETEKGLKIGSIQGTRFQVDHFQLA